MSSEKLEMSESQSVEEKIYTIRGKQVMLDKDLAQLYGVETKRLNEQVRRNMERFPEDFMFQLTMEECLRSSSEISAICIYREWHSHAQQYSPIDVNVFSKAHDRFLIIDDDVYLIGASIKDIGKKWFGFTLMENTSADKLIALLQ